MGTYVTIAIAAGLFACACSFMALLAVVPFTIWLARERKKRKRGLPP